MDSRYASFEDLHEEAEPRLRVALMAAFGPHLGREAALDALAYGWEHWAKLRLLENPIGYLYRVGHRKARRANQRKTLFFPPADQPADTWVEPGLPDALSRLSVAQRRAVVLVHAYGFGLREVAQLLGVSPSTIQQHCERGLRRLRSSLGVTADV